MPRYRRSASAALLVALGLGAASPPAAADLRTYDQFEGHVDVEFAGVGTAGAGSTRGYFSVRRIPEGATIRYAAVYAVGTRRTTEPAAATFDGHALGTAEPFDVGAIRWDVTPYVRDARPYFASAGPFFLVYGLALVVVYEHPSLPVRRIVLQHGETRVPSSSRRSVTFQDFDAGFGEAWLYFTGDSEILSGETVRMNDVVVGGPIDTNLGGDSSLLWVAGRTVWGSNTIEIQTQGDSMYWGLAALVGSPRCGLGTGNVNAAAGPPADVLFLNDSAGGGDRTVELFSYEPLTIFVASPPAMTAGLVPFALYAWTGPPDRATELPGGIGTSCMPMPLSGGDTRLRIVWNNAGRVGRLGAPTAPSAPAPSVVFSDPDGVGKTGTLFLQGLIADTASPSGLAAVTNGVTLIVR